MVACALGRSVTGVHGLPSPTLPISAVDGTRVSVIWLG